MNPATHPHAYRESEFSDLLPGGEFWFQYGTVENPKWEVRELNSGHWFNSVNCYKPLVAVPCADTLKAAGWRSVRAGLGTTTFVHEDFRDFRDLDTIYIVQGVANMILYTSFEDCIGIDIPSMNFLKMLIKQFI